MLLLALLELVNTTAVIIVGPAKSTTGLKPLPVDLKPPLYHYKGGKLGEFVQ